MSALPLASENGAQVSSKLAQVLPVQRQQIEVQKAGESNGHQRGR
jgi:hypothetical protein